MAPKSSHPPSFKVGNLLDFKGIESLNFNTVRHWKICKNTTGTSLSSIFWGAKKSSKNKAQTHSNQNSRVIKERVPDYYDIFFDYVPISYCEDSTYTTSLMNRSVFRRWRMFVLNTETTPSRHSTPDSTFGAHRVAVTEGHRAFGHKGISLLKLEWMWDVWGIWRWNRCKNCFFRNFGWKFREISVKSGNLYIEKNCGFLGVEFGCIRCFRWDFSEGAIFNLIFVPNGSWVEQTNRFMASQPTPPITLPPLPRNKAFIAGLVKGTKGFHKPWS